MARKTSLTVNNVHIKQDIFVEGYVYHVVSGILAGLRDTGEIKTLDLSVDPTGNVIIILNGEDVSLKPFPVEIIRNTLAGMVYALKGVEATLQTLEYKVSN